jgi:plastocyanin
MPARRCRVLALAPVLAIVAAGCGGSSSSTKSTSSAPGGGHVLAVGETQYRLTPADPSAGSGTVAITARNNGTVTHAIAVAGGGAGGKDVRSTDIAPSQTATLTVDLKAGKKYQWYCPIDGHRGLGMRGTITVAGSSGSSANGSSGTGSTAGSSGSSRGAY